MGKTILTKSATLSITDLCWSRRKKKKRKIRRFPTCEILSLWTSAFYFYWINKTSIAGKNPFRDWKKISLTSIDYGAIISRETMFYQKILITSKLIGRILSAQNSNFYFLDTLSLESWRGWGRNNPRAIYSFEWSQFKFLEACGSLHSNALIGRLQKSGKHKLLHPSVFLKWNVVWLPPPIHSRWELKQNNIRLLHHQTESVICQAFRFPVGKYPLVMDWIIFLVENISLASIQSILEAW